VLTRQALKSLSLSALLASAIGGCATRAAEPVTPGPSPASVPPARLEIAAWTTHHGADQGLVGHLYDPRQHRMVSREEAEARVRKASVLVVGEKHDNPDHHRIEAELIAVATEGRKGSLVVEMIARDKQAALTGAESGTPEALATAVDWDHSGWPPFAEYRPVFAAALEHHLTLYAGDMTHETAHLVAHEGLGAVDPALAARFDLSTPLPAEAEKELEQEVADVHCGMLPPKFLAPMSMAQRVRDASLAAAVADADNRAGGLVTVLVSGNGHARTDRGVPALLTRVAKPPVAPGRVLSVGILEVDDVWKQPADYAKEFHAADVPFDLVWFTPRANEDDPCAQMKAPSGK
jgi:uncharacterized iron-regulated protein